MAYQPNFNDKNVREDVRRAREICITWLSPYHYTQWTKKKLNNSPILMSFFYGDDYTNVWLRDKVLICSKNYFMVNLDGFEYITNLLDSWRRK